MSQQLNIDEWLERKKAKEMEEEVELLVKTIRVLVVRIDEIVRCHNTHPPVVQLDKILTGFTRGRNVNMHH